jgi:hypothetical protein
MAHVPIFCYTDFTCTEKYINIALHIYMLEILQSQPHQGNISSSTHIFFTFFNKFQFFYAEDMSKCHNISS